MQTVPHILPITDLRQDATRVLKRIRATHEPAIITQRGRAAAVMVSVEDYQRTQQEIGILRLLARGEQEIAEGKSHDLRDVLADADSLLEDLNR